MKLKAIFAIETPYTVLGDKPRVNSWVFLRFFGDEKNVDKIKMNVRARREISVLLVMCK